VVPRVHLLADILLVSQVAELVSLEVAVAVVAVMFLLLVLIDDVVSAGTLSSRGLGALTEAAGCLAGGALPALIEAEAGGADLGAQDRRVGDLDAVCAGLLVALGAREDLRDRELDGAVHAGVLVAGGALADGAEVVAGEAIEAVRHRTDGAEGDMGRALEATSALEASLDAEGFRSDPLGLYAAFAGRLEAGRALTRLDDPVDHGDFLGKGDPGIERAYFVLSSGREGHEHRIDHLIALI
jgi:hypothetical protein